MRLGLIADVHANLPALEAVLSDMPPIDDLVCAGDVVGYNPWPVECVERIREVASVTVQGNHDRTVRKPARYRHNRMAEAGLEYALEALDDDQLAWLDGLPFRAEIANGGYLLGHSHPDPDKRGTYVYPADFPSVRSEIDEYRGCILGHTHVQHEATIDDRLIVNPGSVGQPRDADPRAAYAVLDTGTNSVDLRRIEYDVERVQARIRAEGLPERTATRLGQGR